MTQQEEEVQSLIQNLPKIEVVGGQDISGNPNIINSPVMQFVMLASIASQAVKIRKYFDDRTPSGYIQAITIPVTQVRQRIDLPWVAQSISIINDGDLTQTPPGPSPALVWINTLERPPHQINLNEALNLNFEVHKLRRLYLQCNPGNIASVRIVAQD